MVIKPQFAEVHGGFHDGLALVYTPDGEGLSTFLMNGKYGYLDTMGQIAIECRFTHAAPFSDGRAVASDAEPDASGMVTLVGVIDAKGDYVVKPHYNVVKQFSEGFAAVGLDGKWGYINADGKVVVPLQYEDAQGFSEGLAAVREKGLWGFISAKE